MNEFELIQRYFHRPSSDAAWLSLGIGDDAAVMQPEAGFDLVVCSDTLIAGRHFPRSTPAQDIGWKALAVNLSDLAAMGATPRGFLLNLTLPDADEAFLKGFADGLFQMADHAGAVLIGGDTTRGNLSISITAIGQVRSGKALKRSGAQAQDRIVLVGDLGGAALALQQGDAAEGAIQRRLHRPKPFVAEGQILADFASSAIDISDGLVADLNHILQASQCGAELELDQLRLPLELQVMDHEEAMQLALYGGDDYALLATMSEQAWQDMQKELPEDLRFSFATIGRIVGKRGILGHHPNGQPQAIQAKGYQHFS